MVRARKCWRPLLKLSRHKLHSFVVSATETLTRMLRKPSFGSMRCAMCVSMSNVRKKKRNDNENNGWIRKFDDTSEHMARARVCVDYVVRICRMPTHSPVRIRVQCSGDDGGERGITLTNQNDISWHSLRMKYEIENFSSHFLAEAIGFACVGAVGVCAKNIDFCMWNKASEIECIEFVSRMQNTLREELK